MYYQFALSGVGKCFLGLLFLLPSLLAEMPRLESGQLGEARFLIAAPPSASEIRGAILLTHGYRPEEAVLSAEFPWDQAPYRSWLEAGYLIASTSYRRNGWILDDAVEDLETLRAKVAQDYSIDGPFYLYGESMGGAIITRIAEDPDLAPHYAGTVALSAALYPDSFAPDLEWEHAPRFPLLYLSNSNEMAPLERYAEPFGDLAESKVALWRVDRPGHVNFEPAEEAAAFQALLGWITHGTIAPRHNPTVQADAFVSEATWSDHAAATAPILRVDPTFGNLDTGFTAADFDRLGIGVGDAFTVSANGNAFTGHRGVTYSDVPRGEWIAVQLPAGQIRLAINYGHAAHALEVDPLDEVTIRKVVSERSGKQ